MTRKRDHLELKCTAEPADTMLAELFGGEIQISAVRGRQDKAPTTIVLDVATAERLGVWLAAAVKSARTHVLGQ